LALLTLVVGALGVVAVAERASATTAAAQRAEPLLVEAQTIDTALSDADTTAAASFLQGRLEPASLEARYQADLAQASTALATAAQSAGTDPSVTSALRTLSVELPRYTGLVQSATFNERQGYYPLAASYLAEANNLVRTVILPAADQLYAVEGARLTADQGGAAGLVWAVLAAVGLVVLLVALVLAQRWLSRHFRRTFNLALVAATALMAVLGLWAGVALATQGSAVDQAVAEGSSPIAAYTQARIVALELRADDELTLLTRDSVPSYQEDYQGAAKELDRTLASVGGSTAADRQRLTGVQADAAAYGTVHTTIRHDDQTGQLAQAVAVAAGSAPTDLPAVSATLDSSLTEAISGAQQSFEQDMNGASSDLDGLLAALVVLSILAAVLIWLGFRPRIGEYR